MRPPRPHFATPALADPAELTAAMRELYGREARARAADALGVAADAADADQARVWTAVCARLRRGR